MISCEALFNVFNEKGITFFPSNMAIGTSRQEEFAFQAGRITAKELRAMGVHMNLAPVADIHRNIINDIIGDRTNPGVIRIGLICTITIGIKITGDY